MRLRPREFKFIVDSEVGAALREAARKLLAPDPHATGPCGDQYRTTTLYFDTDELAVYQRRGSYGRAKFRVRRYGDADTVFLERKLRTKDILSKRRSTLSLNELARLAEGSLEPHKHVRWFQRRLLTRRLTAVCRISYLRTARVAMTEDGPIRLTLDDELMVTPVSAVTFNGHVSPIPLTDRTIVELKFTGSMPSVFKQIVEDFALTPARLSKYRLGVEATRLAAAR